MAEVADGHAGEVGRGERKGSKACRWWLTSSPTFAQTSHLKEITRSLSGCRKALHTARPHARVQARLARRASALLRAVRRRRRAPAARFALNGRRATEGPPGGPLSGRCGRRVLVRGRRGPAANGVDGGGRRRDGRGAVALLQIAGSLRGGFRLLEDERAPGDLVRVELEARCADAGRGVREVQE